MKKNGLGFALLGLAATALLVHLACIQSNGLALTDDYLGFTPVINVPAVFAPGLVSTDYSERCAPTFSKEMDEIYWSVFWASRSPEVILTMKRTNGQWSEPEVASFSGQYSDGGAFFSPDNQRLYFHSNRPLEGHGEPKDFDIWYVDRLASGWSEPINAGKAINTETRETFPTVSANGTLYFNGTDEAYVYGICIYSAQWVDGAFRQRIPLPEVINSKKGFNWCPSIHPDEAYLLFSSGRDGQEFDDIYISLKNQDHSWAEPIKLSSSVNSEFNDRFPRISPDGRFLFYASNRTQFRTYFDQPQTWSDLKKHYADLDDDIYWVDAKVIEPLNPGRHE